jgi:molybdate transport system substrate-binding protein
MRTFHYALLCLLLAPLAVADSINVAAAISLKESISQIAKSFEADTGHRVDFTFGASGQLMAQIKTGAPIDAFISAANKQVDDLDQLGLIDRATRRNIVGNALVLIVPADATANLSDFKALAGANIKKLAIGEPKTVPAGQYAQQLLKKLDLEAKLSGRLVYGSNVRQVLDYVVRGEVTAGIVYATDAKEAGDKVKIAAVADPSTHDPIQYPAVVIKGTRKQDVALRFLDYLKTEKAIKTFEAAGFTPAEPPAAKPSK